MSRLHNKNISLIDEVDTIIIDHEMLSGDRIKAPGEYKISETIVDDRKIAMITATHEDKHQSKNLIIMDDTDKILLEGIYFKRKCMRNALNIYSPAGFLLGTVKERYFKWSADFEIFAANQKILFHASQEKNTKDYSIKKADNELIAKVTKSPSPTGQLWYTITYLRHIPALHKILVLFEVLSSCQQESSSFVSKVSRKVIDTICCQLYYDSKIKFCILCVLFPLVIVAYLIFILMFVAYFVGTLFTLLIAKCYSLYNNSDMDLLCAFTWPCRLCKNNHECLDYICCNNDTYCTHFSMGGPFIILLCLVLGVYAFLSLA